MALLTPGIDLPDLQPKPGASSTASAASRAAVSPATARAPDPIAERGHRGGSPALVTRFGSKVDVRNRGAVRIRRLAGAGLDGAPMPAPAVVRLWHADHCDELTIGEARALAAQLIAAAALADGQNRR